ncbi:MAG: hypothetical protein WBJ41_01970 [Chromatiaceae bacterium]
MVSGTNLYSSLLILLLVVSTGNASAAEEPQAPAKANESAVATPPPPVLPVPVTESANPTPEPESQPSSEASAGLDVLKQRVLARWAAMIDRDFHRAYQYASPAYRAVFTAKDFAARTGGTKINWQRVEIVSVKTETEEAAKVEIRMFAEAFLADTEKSVPVATVFSESWIRSAGEWWFVPGK